MYYIITFNQSCDLNVVMKSIIQALGFSVLKYII